MSIAATSFYVTGGTLQHDAACYVERQADVALFDALMQSRFCYVLTSRQMGKSSLMVRTATRLREEGVSVAVLDLTSIGQNLNPEQWYNGLLTQLGVRLDIEDELDDFSYAHKHISPLQRWMRAIREIVLERCKGKVVIFVDEIDTVRSMPFSADEFFAGIREFYNDRSQDPELERLTFCLLGVATPSDLIRDTRTTPFNIGQRIELNDFSEAEAAPLAKGLLREEKTAKQLLGRILYWTSGHPYLTQMLCRAIVEDTSINSANDVDRLCGELFFSHRAQERDDNLLFVRERMLRSEADIAGLLELYKQVHKGKKVRDDDTNPLVTILRLSGIAKVEQGCLRTRNRIYHRVFDDEWVRQNMPDAELRRQRAAYVRGLVRATAVSVVVLAVMAGLLFFAVRQRNNAEHQELVNRRQLYASQIALAYQAWEKGDAGQAVKLLDNHLPKPRQEDLRGFEWDYLWRLCHADLFTLRHTILVESVAFSPNGKILATGSQDATAKLWDVTGGRELAALKGHTASIFSVSFSPDGKMLATGSNDATAKLWDVASVIKGTVIEGHAGTVNSIAFSPDGKTLVTASADHSVKLWNSVTGQQLATLVGHTDSVNFAAFSPDGKLIASASDDNTARLWNATTRQNTAVLKGHKAMVNSAAFSPDGKTLATASSDRTVKLWDTTTGQELTTLSGHSDSVYAVQYSPDGSRLATGSWDKTVKIWDAASKRELAVLKGHTGKVCNLVFSSDGKTLASGSWERGNGEIKLWDVTTGKEKLTILELKFSGPIVSVAFSPDGKRLAVAGRNSLKLWDIVVEQEMVALKGDGRSILSVAFSPDGKTIAAGSYDKVMLWRSTIDKEALTPKPIPTDSDKVIQAGLLNFDFEQGEIGQFPVGWYSSHLVKEDGFTAKLTEERPKRGRLCALLTRDAERSSVLKRGERMVPLASLIQTFEARSYCGKRVRFRAAVRIEASEPGARAQLVLLTARSGGQEVFQDNMADRPIMSNEWRYYEIVGDIDEDAQRFTMGITLYGEGKAYIDDITFEIIGKATPKKSEKNAKESQR